MTTTLRITMLVIGIPIALVLFGIVMLVGLLVFGIPLLLVVLLATGLSTIIATIVSIAAFVYYAAREEDHAPDPGNYSLDQTKSSDEK